MVGENNWPEWQLRCFRSTVDSCRICQFGSAALALSPPNVLPAPSLLDAGERGGWRDSLHAVGALLSSSQNTAVLSKPF